MKKTCKSIFRRTLSFVVTAAMCLSLLPAAVFAEEDTGELSDGTVQNSIVQEETAPDPEAPEGQTEPSKDGEEPGEPEPGEDEAGKTEPVEGEDQTELTEPAEGEDQTELTEPAEGEDQTEPTEPAEGEGNEDKAEPNEGEGDEDKTDSKEDLSEDEEKEDPAEHVHNEDGWSCVWSECIHEHSEECYVPSEEDVLNCTHVCGEECLANIEGFWNCTEPEETPVYATVEELEAVFEAVGEALESGDIQAGIDALDAYLAVYNQLSPEDQEANAEAKEAALAYRQTLEDAKKAEENDEDYTDPEINALGNTSSNQTVYFKTVKVYNVKTYEEFTFDVGTNFPVRMSGESYNSVSWTIPELSAFLAKSNLYSGYTYTMAQSWNSPNLYGVYSSGFTAQTGGQKSHQPGSTVEVVMNHPQDKTITYYVTKFTPGSSGTGGNTDEDFTYGTGSYSRSAIVKYHSNYPDGTDYVVTQNIKLNVWTPNPPWNVFDFPFKSYSGCNFGGYTPKDNEKTWYTDSTCINQQHSTLVVQKNGDVIHLYAGWKTEEGEKKDPVTLTYMDRDKQYGKTESYISGTDVLISDCTNTYANHTFEGWDTDPSADEVVYKKDESFTITENTILYAVWKPIDSDPGTTTDNFTVVKSFVGLDDDVTLPAVTLSYEAYRTKDGTMVGDKESGNVTLTLNGNEYTGTINPTVWDISTNDGALSAEERARYKNVFVITEDLDSAKVNGYTWNSFNALYLADGTNVDADSVKFTLDGATFQKILSVKNTYTKNVRTSMQTVTLGVHFTKDTSAGSTKMPELSDIPSNFQLSYSYTDADNITRTATLNVSSANKWLDGDANNCPTLTWAPFKVKVAEGSPVIITLKESNYLIGDNASEFIWTRSSSVNGGKMEEGTGQVKVIYAGWDRNTKAYAFNYYKQPDVDNPKLTGITKELVGATVNGETADINNLSVTKGDVVVLRYQITVKGEKNAKYIVTDDDVTVVSGSLEGTIGDSGEAVIIVTKTATANEVGTLNVTNTAYVKPKDEGTDPIPEDPAKPDDPDKGHPSDEVKTDIPVNEPNPKLTGIEKKLVSPEEPVTVKRGESVELVYEITVTGEKGAKYEVSDPEASDTTWKGIIDESGKAVITVTKTFTPTDEQKGTVTVKNTAYVKPNGEGTDPIKPEDPDKDPTDPEKGYPSNEVETEITIEEPNPKLKSIVKELVTPEPVTVKVGESVTLEYTITITGDEGAEYKVTDDGADLKEGSWDGKLGESGEAVIIVTKTVTPTEAGTLTVTNTALVSPGEGTDPIKPVDPENPDAPVDPEPSNTVTTDITVTEENEITITWLLGYGDNEVYGDIAKAPAGTKEVDSDLYPENNPTRPGYTFTGWGNPVIDPITGNITITAQWRQNTPTNPDPTDPTPTDPDPDPTPDSDPDPDPDPDPTPVRRVTVNAPDEPTPLANIADTPVPLAAPSDLIDIFDDDVPLAGGAQTGNNDALWYLLAALSLAGLGVLKLLEKKNTTK